MSEPRIAAPDFDSAEVRNHDRRVVRRTGMALILIGLASAGIGGATARSDLAALRTWSQVDALVLRSRVVSKPGLAAKLRLRRHPDALAVTFRYQVNARTLESTATYGLASRPGRPTEVAHAYSAGTVHRIWYDPDQPSLIRFDLDRGLFSIFFVSSAMILTGGVFIALGALVLRLLGPSGRRLSSRASRANRSS